MIDTLFQEGTDLALDDKVRRPGPAQPPAAPGAFNNFWSAAGGNLAGAGLSTLAFKAEMAGAFGDVMSGLGTDTARGMFSTQTPEEARAADVANARTLNSQTPYSNAAGDMLRQKARDLMPDPATTGAASQIIGGVLGFGAKAAGYMTAGPFGAVGLGLDEGFAESDRLRLAGVDQATRTEAGAVSGITAGGSMFLPMTGATRGARFLKGAIGGEAATVGQSAAEKAILEHAGYHDLGSTFDPLDPVALAVGLVPGAVGAGLGHAVAPRAKSGLKPLADMGLGERQAVPFNDTRLDAYAVAAAQREGIPPEALLAIKNAGEKSGSTATSPAGAQGVMQFMPDTFKAYGQGDPTDPLASIDAGARYMKALIGQYGGDVRAAIAHYNGGNRAGRAVHAGELPPAAETQAYLQRTDAYTAAQVGAEAGRVNARDPEVQSAARVRQVADAMDESRLTPDDDFNGATAHQDALATAHDQMAAGEPVNVAGDLRLPEPSPLADRVAALEAERAAAPDAPASQLIGSATGRLADDTGVSTARAAADLGRHDIAAVVADRLEAAASPTAPAARAIANEAPAAQRLQRPGATAAAADQVRAARSAPEPDRPAPPAPRETKGEPAKQPPPAAGEKPEAGPSQATLAMQAAKVLELNPDMLVHMDGMAEPRPVGDLLEAVRAEAANDKQGASLVDVAALCFLRNG